MLKEAKVTGVKIDKEWSYQGRSGKHHIVYVIWADPMPDSDNQVGFQVEVLKFPVTRSETDNAIRMLQPADIVDIDFNRYGKPEYLKYKSHSESVL